MLWPSARLRRPRDVAIQERIAAARGHAPESEAWLGLLEAALAETEDGGVSKTSPRLAAERPVKAPLLARATVMIDDGAADGWVRRLVALAGVVNGNGGEIDATALLEAALCQDDARVDALGAAVGGGASPQAFRVVGQMAALPLLQACGRALAAELPTSWWEGYCPLCGAWPVVAEYTGLERQRRLRCGRCGSGWAIPTLRCVFCDETGHEQLGLLTLEGGDQTRKVEVCKTCKGYLKAVNTVRPLAPWAILLDDLMTVHLDVAALERGFERPATPAYALDARLESA